MNKISAEDFRKRKLTEVMHKPATVNQEDDIGLGYLQVRNSPSEFVGVVNDHGKLVGALTKTRVLEEMIELAKSKNDKVKEVMYDNPVKIEQKQTIDEAIIDE